MTNHELRLAAARNLAGWHDVSVRALGLRPNWDDGWWTCPMAAPNIYHSAITLRPAADDADRDVLLERLEAHVRDPAGGYVSVCDSWDELPLHDVPLDRRAEAPWCVRQPAPVPADEAAPPGLRIERVAGLDALAEFERAVVVGFGARLPVAPFDIHAPGILDDPAMVVLLGRFDADDAGGGAGVVDGDAVAVSMAYVADGLVGVYGVATVPAARQRGYATAMTIAALAVAPDLPAMLQPSSAALPLYRRLGFVDVGWFSHWT